MSENINNSNTPWTYNFDLLINKNIQFRKSFRLSLFLKILNLFNTKNVINVYEQTGTASYDGVMDPQRTEWLTDYYGDKIYDLYNAINTENGQAYWDYLGKQLYGQPRQILFGINVSY